jgi:hypothetical protein
VRNAAREIGGAVDRIDDPSVAAEIAPGLLSEKRIFRERASEQLADYTLNFGIRFQNVVLWPLKPRARD